LPQFRFQHRDGIMASTGCNGGIEEMDQVLMASTGVLSRGSRSHQRRERRKQEAKCTGTIASTGLIHTLCCVSGMSLHSESWMVPR